VRRQGKYFFFEKKQQKTFADLGLWRSHPRGHGGIKSFLRAFFQKSASLPFSFRVSP
jgi:hypothetical protein